MLLHELPNELLLRVACLLDVKSLISFGRTSSRMKDVSLDALKYVTVKEPTEAVMEYLRKYGPLVRSMDLSHTRISFSRLLKSVADCRRLKSLNLVNSAIPHSDLLCILRLLPKLETLSFTMEVFDEHHDLVFEKLGPFKSIKKLYVEVASDFMSCKVLIDFLNECRAIEMVHVSFVGDYDWDRTVFVPPLAADRWKTLHTFVCACWLACRGRGHTIFLQSIFAHKPSSECTRWIEEEKNSYVYERGFFNYRATKEVFTPKMLEDTELLRKHQVVSMSEGGEQPLKTPWGLPWSLRILGVENWASELNKMSLLETLSPQLGELDLREVHGSYTEEFRLSIVTSSPNLTVLALPVCFFISPATDSNGTALQGSRERGLGALTEALKKLKLKKFYLRGSLCHELLKNCCSVCAAKLTSANLIHLSELSHLEELSFSRVHMDNSVYDSIGNKNLRSVGLHLLPASDFSGIVRFAQQSPNLRNFKLRGFRVIHHVDHIEEVLNELVNLRQLCLEPNEDSIPMGRLLGMLPRLPLGLEVFHFHSLHNEDLNLFADELALAVRDLGGARGRKISYDDSATSLTSVRCVFMTQSICGRGLCSQQSSIGYVKPVGWEVE